MTSYSAEEELVRIDEAVRRIVLEYGLSDEEYDELAFWAAEDILTEIMKDDELIEELMGYVRDNFLDNREEK